MSQGPERVGGGSGGNRPATQEDEQLRLRRQIEESAAQHVQRTQELQVRETARVSDDDSVRVERVRDRERVAPAHQTNAANTPDARVAAQDNERLAALGEVANDDTRRGEVRLVDMQSLHRHVRAADESSATRDALRDDRARELRDGLDAELSRRVNGVEARMPAQLPRETQVALAEMGGGLRDDDRNA